jgi:AGCS family alanine or glycine:cation symporter
MAGALMSLKTVWSLADITMGLMTLCNLVAIFLLGKRAILLLQDYNKQRKSGIDPVFSKKSIAEFANDDSIECW